MDIEDFRKQIRTMELPSEAMRFDLLRQLADIKPPVQAICALSRAGTALV